MPDLAAALASLTPGEARVALPELLARLKPAFPGLRAEALGMALTRAGWTRAQWRLPGGGRVRGYYLPPEALAQAARAAEVTEAEAMSTSPSASGLPYATGARTPAAHVTRTTPLPSGPYIEFVWDEYGHIHAVRRTSGTSS